jgi:hypothetical protein
MAFWEMPGLNFPAVQSDGDPVAPLEDMNSWRAERFWTECLRSSPNSGFEIPALKGTWSSWDGK